MRTVLIPTDFTSVPLLLLKHITISSREELHVVFMYSTRLNDSITDLLFYSPKKIIDRAITKEFNEGCSIIQNRYPDKIKSIRYELFHGNNASVFASLANTIKVDEVLLPQEYSFSQRHFAFDPTPYILNSGVPIREIDLQLPVRMANHDLIASLLTS